MHDLVFQNVTKGFTTADSRVDVLHDVTFTVPKGSFFAVMGPSGSGKSTLLHLAAGLLLPDSGTVTVGGTNLADLDDDARTLLRRRSTGVIFQDFNLIPTLTLEDNITLSLTLDGRKPDPAELDKVLVRLGLAPRRRHYPAQLSGGERQRAAIARTLLIQPQIILADEPTGNLDIHAGHDFCSLLAQINKDFGTTILLVSHDPVVAAAAETVCILTDGRIHSQFQGRGQADEVSRQYLQIIRKNA